MEADDLADGGIDLGEGILREVAGEVFGVVEIAQHGFDEIAVEDAPQGLAGLELVVQAVGNEAGEAGCAGAGFTRDGNEGTGRVEGEATSLPSQLQIEVALRFFEVGG